MSYEIHLPSYIPRCCRIYLALLLLVYTTTVCLFLCFITKSFLTYSFFFSPTPALSTISRSLSSSMCSITPETANVGSSYNRMRGPGISAQDRFPMHKVHGTVDFLMFTILWSINPATINSLNHPHAYSLLYLCMLYEHDEREYQWYNPIISFIALRILSDPQCKYFFGFYLSSHNTPTTTTNTNSKSIHTLWYQT